MSNILRICKILWVFRSLILLILRDKFTFLFKLLYFFLAYLMEINTNISQGKRLRLALENLGPLFVKFGQLLSTRRDILYDELADELAFLQDKVKPFLEKLRYQLLRNPSNKN